ncbi:calcium-binding protein [Rhodobacteraceae bacterium D3-12]|nr:calcium-binding protein [Rhodobacteraceae bacterium D3-12]
MIPVAKILSELFSEGPIAGIDPRLLYVDGDPHGTATLYLLAGMVTYSALYGEPAPVGLDLGESIAPDVRRAYPLLAQEIWKKLEGEKRAEAPSAAPVAPVAASSAPAVPAAPAAAVAANASAKPAAATAGLSDTGLANPSLAMGLNGVADWTTQQPFVDIMKTARPWQGHEGPKWGAWDAARLEREGYLDDAGWPKALPPKVDRIESFILTDQNEGATKMAGRYRVTWQGEGRLRVGGRLRNVARIKGKKELWFDYTPGSGEVALSILSTDPDKSGDHIREIRVLREDQIALYDLGVTFNPDWIARIADIRVLRFMDWMLTNGSPVNRWEGRPQLDDFSYGWRGVPIEVMVELSNFIGADPWFNMPHAADDVYAERFAEMVLERLDPRLHVYVEYSNEVWNHGFPQAVWLGEEARKRWGRKAGDDAWMQFAGMRGAEMMRVWGAVFSGPEAARLHRVVAVHTGWMGLEEPLLEAPLWQAEQGNGAVSPAAHFDAYAVSGYFGFELGTEEEGRLADLRRWIAQSRELAEQSDAAQGLQRRALDAAIEPIRFDAAIPKAAEAIREGSLKELTQTLWPYHAGVAKRYGFALIMYEGGSHAVGHGAASNDEELTAFFHAFSYSEAMAALYREELEAWRGVGGTLFNAFVDVARPSQFGSWGGLRHLQDDNPRWRALMAQNARAPQALDSRMESAFLHGLMLRADPGGTVLTGSAQSDILLGDVGDDTLISNGAGDFLDGGPGDDLARFPGAREDYRFAIQGPRLLATRNGVSTRLLRIERLSFAADPERIYRLELAQ